MVAVNETSERGVGKNCSSKASITILSRTRPRTMYSLSCHIIGIRSGNSANVEAFLKEQVASHLVELLER